MALIGCSFFLYDELLVKSRVHSEQDTIRLASIQPHEVDCYVVRLLERLSVDVRANAYYIETALLYGRKTKGTKEARQYYMSLLKRSRDIGYMEQVKYIMLLLRGKLIRVAKMAYRCVFDRVYRGAK